MLGDAWPEKGTKDFKIEKDSEFLCTVFQSMASVKLHDGTRLQLQS